jgi:hypothetical protein
MRSINSGYDSWLAQQWEQHNKPPTSGSDTADIDIGEHSYKVEFEWEIVEDCDVDEDIDEDGHRYSTGRTFKTIEISLRKVWVDGVLDDDDSTDALRDEFVEQAKQWVRDYR